MRIENDGQMRECLTALVRYQQESMEGGPLTDLFLSQLLAALCTAKEVACQRAEGQPQAEPFTAESVEAKVRALMDEQQEHFDKVLEDVKSAMGKVGIPTPKRATARGRPAPRKRKASKRP